MGALPTDWLWYFAYGSNLDPDTFLGRRRMQPRDSRAVCLDGFQLVFDLPIGPGERAVANLRPAPSGRVHGVVWQIHGRDAAFLDRTEGVHRGFYRRVAIETRDTEDRTIPAFTYLSNRGRPGRRPSERYLGLLLRGARHHRLPEAWVDWLDSLERAVDERATDPSQPGP